MIGGYISLPCYRWWSENRADAPGSVEREGKEM
jgi:hypothetical protein